MNYKNRKQVLDFLFWGLMAFPVAWPSFTEA
jgi:hypothetical protein